MLFIGFAKVFFMLSGSVQRILLAAIVPSAADFGDFATVNSFLNIPNNTVVQGTIQGVSKLTAEDDARAGAVQRAGLRLRRGAGAADRAAAVRRARRSSPTSTRRRGCRRTSASPR